MASSAGSRNRRETQSVIQTAHTSEINLLRIEQLLAPRNARAAARLSLPKRAILLPVCACPRIEQIEDHRCKRRSTRISSERVIHADKKCCQNLFCQKNRATVRSA